jgi:hypothetical protein
MKDFNQFTDDELVKLYREGNNQAFEVLLNRYQSKVYTYIFLIVRNRELTEDIFRILLLRPFLPFSRIVMLNRENFWRGSIG